MANIVIEAVLSDNKQSVTIRDTGSDYTDLPKADITSIVARFYGSDKSSPLASVTFTSLERVLFLNTQSSVAFNFSDIRLFNKTFPDDNFYTVDLLLSTASNSATSNGSAFSIELALEESVHINNSSVTLPTEDLFNTVMITQAAVALDTLARLSSSTSPDREQKWRDIYEFIEGSIINRF